MTERHTNPDGSLTLLVIREDGDITIGFEGFPWHTHGDIIAGLRGEADVEVAVRSYVDDLIHDRVPIVVMKKKGIISEPYIADFPDEPVSTKYFESDESYEIKYWSGMKRKPIQSPQPTRAVARPERLS